LQRTPYNLALLYAACVFLSAFLLFEVQPLVAKQILPWFGGSAGVWTTCMLFFQWLLLCGYAYAHGLSRSRWPWAHAVVLGAAALMFKIIPNEAWKPTQDGDPIGRILLLLSVTVGLPYFMLASTSPLLQSWYARQYRDGAPYRFFALSNLASMLALLSYPLLIEPHVSLHAQAWAWSAAFLVCVALNAALFRRIPAAQSVGGADPGWPPAAAPRGRDRLMWVLLPACASGLLLAVTNHITQNIAAIPLFWVVPLAVYLLSFILTFESTRWYHRALLALFAPVLLEMGYALDERGQVQRLGILLPLFLGGLFLCCMVCHGELARTKPATRWLTSFYLMVAFGGALGGLFVAVVAPETFPALWEFPILLVLTPAVILIRLLLEHRDPRVIPAPAALTGSRAFSWLGGGARFWSLWTLSSLAVVGLAGYLAQGQWQDRSAARLLTRNFYGALSVADYEDPDLRELAHGTIIHGEQYLSADKRRIPLTYYAPGTGVGLLMQDMVRQGRLRLGVIGLGAGTMAAWGRPGDTVRFYEINRAMVDIARTQFSYLGDCGCRPEVIMGDARLSLEREAGEQYDVLVVDAFSGDSIPVHLLTREAFEVYFRHLRPDGILAVHVTNSYLDLSHPVAAVAHDLGREAHLIVNEEDEASATFSSDWMLIGTQLSRRFAWIGAKETPVAPLPGRGVWTDDYSNLWEAMHH
jgi:hypothetical protein